MGKRNLSNPYPKGESLSIEYMQHISSTWALHGISWALVLLGNCFALDNYSTKIPYNKQVICKDCAKLVTTYLLTHFQRHFIFLHLFGPVDTSGPWAQHVQQVCNVFVKFVKSLDSTHVVKILELEDLHTGVMFENKITNTLTWGAGTFAQPTDRMSNEQNGNTQLIPFTTATMS